MRAIQPTERTTIWGNLFSDDGTPMGDDESLLEYEARLVDKRIARCGIYNGAEFCDCGNQFVNHPAHD